MKNPDSEICCLQANLDNVKFDGLNTLSISMLNFKDITTLKDYATYLNNLYSLDNRFKYCLKTLRFIVTFDAKIEPFLNVSESADFKRTEIDFYCNAYRNELDM